MKHKNKILLFFIVLFFLTLSGCRFEKSNDINDLETTDIEENIIENLEPVEGGKISIPLTNFSTLNPLLTDNSSYYHFSKLIFQGIFEFDDNLKPSLKLGESYEISEDGKRVFIKLREDVKWHDGQALTSSDVKFTIDSIKKAGINGTYGKIFNEGVSINEEINLNSFINSNIIDTHNIEIVFDREFSNILEILTFPIIPKHIFPNSIGVLNIDDYRPMGTGPFKFMDYERFKSVNLKRNTEYWDGTVYIEEIVGRVLEDDNLILTSFESGQIDFAFSKDVDWDKYRQNKRINVYEYISSEYEFLGFNFQNQNFSQEQSIAIRKAINYGIDRQSIIENQYLGHATQIDIPFHPDSFLVSDIANQYGYNVNFAKEELKDAGYIDSDGDGILEDMEGNPLKFTLLTNTYNLSRLRTAEIIIEDLRKIGIDISLSKNIERDYSISQEEKDGEWTNIESNLATGSYDIVLLGWKTSVIPNIGYMFHSTKVLDTNFIKYEDEDMDRLLGLSLNSSYNKKQENYKLLQENILNNLPYVSLFYKNKALLADSKIKGELKPKFFNLYDGIENCFIIDQEKN